MRPPITKDEKTLVKHLSKKAKLRGKRVNVYYNRKNSKGESNYLTGKFFSKKNNKKVTYRSSYELRYFHLLEADNKVASYEVESVSVPYNEPGGKKRKYIPDVMVLYTNGDIDVCEIKPKDMLPDTVVQAKANACRIYFTTLLRGSGINFNFRFVTEKDLFKTTAEYYQFIKENNKKAS